MKADGIARSRPVPGLGLGLKINLLLLAIQVPALAIVAYQTSREVREMVQEQGRGQAARLAQDLQDRLAAQKPEGYADAVRKFFESVTGLQLSATVFVADGFQLRPQASVPGGAEADPDEDDFTAFRENSPVHHSVDLPARALAVVHRPFKNAAGAIIGVIRLELDQTENMLLVRSSNRQLFLGMVVVFALSVAVLFVGMAILVVRPVKSLAAAMARAREGRLETVAVAYVKDEVGLLARSYNGMVQRLRALLEDKEALLFEVRDLNLNLQNRVDEATKDLARSHRALQKAYHDLYASQRELHRLERLASLGQVAREIAHEFATPLNVISGTLQMLLEDANLAPEHRDRLRRVLSQTERLIQTSRDTLSPLRMPSPELGPADLNALVGEVAAFMAPAFAARGVEFHSRLHRGLPPVRADLHQMEQVLLNLVSNALDALPEGGSISVETSVEEANGARSVLLEVRDDGKGIAPEHLPRIFDPFFTTKGAGRGTGLGLAICKEIVSQHRGDIGIASRPGQGTTVAIRLPALATAAAAAVAGEAAA